MMAKIGFGFLACLVFALCIGISEWKDAEFEQRMQEAEARICTMQQEHEAAIAVADKALRERRELYEQEKKRLCEAEAVMGKYSDWCAMPVPDDLHDLLFHKNASAPATAGSNVPAPTGAAGTH